MSTEDRMANEQSLARAGRRQLAGTRTPAPKRKTVQGKPKRNTFQTEPKRKTVQTEPKRKAPEAEPKKLTKKQRAAKAAKIARANDGRVGAFNAANARRRGESDRRQPFDRRIYAVNGAHVVGGGLPTLGRR